MTRRESIGALPGQPPVGPSRTRQNPPRKVVLGRILPEDSDERALLEAEAPLWGRFKLFSFQITFCPEKSVQLIPRSVSLDLQREKAP